VAAPDSLAAWREFVSASISNPSTSRWSGSVHYPGEKERYDQARSPGCRPGDTRHGDTDPTDPRTRRNIAQTATARRGLAISGSAGRGKSTTALLIGRRHERMMRTKLGRHDDGFTPSSLQAPHQK
jgi:hypothetical protein